MTHDELIEKMDDIDVAISNGFGSAKVFLGCIRAVRTIIELHKSNDDGLTCNECTASETEWYPCPTIKAIVKELE